MNGAKILDMQDITGQIKEGLCADLLIADGDVSQDIKALENVNTVYLDGEIVFQKSRHE